MHPEIAFCIKTLDHSENFCTEFWFHHHLVIWMGQDFNLSAFHFPCLQNETTFNSFGIIWRMNWDSDSVCLKRYHIARHSLLAQWILFWCLVVQCKMYYYILLIMNKKEKCKKASLFYKNFSVFFWLFFSMIFDIIEI